MAVGTKWPRQSIVYVARADVLSDLVDPDGHREGRLYGIRPRDVAGDNRPSYSSQSIPNFRSFCRKVAR